MAAELTPASLTRLLPLQVENEYGSYHACDAAYMEHLKGKLQQHLGETAVLFTTDGDGKSYLDCGTTEGAYATIDFGPGTDVSAAFAVQRQAEPQGPLVNSEYYPGWLDHWGYPHSTRATADVVSTLSDMLHMDANVNVYVAHGGTSFGFSAGSNLGDTFMACPTSYDYDAPIAENGNLTDKYFVMRYATLKVATWAVPDPPPQPAVGAYGTVQMTASEGLLETLQEVGSEPVIRDDPLTFEQLQQAYGFVLYSHNISGQYPDPVQLNVTGLRDRGYVFVDGKPVGVLSRGDNQYQMTISVKDRSRLQILVENQGRICFGNFLNDLKGIVSPVFLGEKKLVGWEHLSIPLNSTQLPTIERHLSGRPSNRLRSASAPGFFSGQFDLPSDVDFYDTFLRLDGWGRGVAFVNGFNLGRYWPDQGPQVTLYVPGTLLTTAANRLTLLELETAPCHVTDTCHVTLTDTPELDGPTPHK